MTRFDSFNQLWQQVPVTWRAPLGAAITLGAFLLVLFFNLLPAARLIQGAAGDHTVLDAQLLSMQTLAAQAKLLSGQGQGRANRDGAVRWLDTSIKQQWPNKAQTATSGDRVTVTFSNAPADALAAWLTEARGSAQLLPAEARLVRSDAGWNGELVFTLPTR